MLKNIIKNLFVILSLNVKQYFIIKTKQNNNEENNLIKNIKKRYIERMKNSQGYKGILILRNKLSSFAKRVIFSTLLIK